MGIHLSLKAKLVTSTDVAKELKSTMKKFNRACNTISELSVQQDLRRRYDIHHAAYRLIRDEKTLPSQHVINAIAKVGDAYKREPDKLHQFKPHSSVRYDARTMVLGEDCHTVSLTVCSKGRVSGRLQMSAKMRRQLYAGKPGSAELVYRKGQFYLHISITVTVPKIARPAGSLGVDLGVNRVAVTTNRKFQHDLAAMGRLFCEYSPKEVNRPEAVRSRNKSAQAKPGTASPH